MLVPAGNMDSDDEVRGTKRMGYLALDDQCIIIHAFCPALHSERCDSGALQWQPARGPGPDVPCNRNR